MYEYDRATLIQNTSFILVSVPIVLVLLPASTRKWLAAWLVTTKSANSHQKLHNQEQNDNKRSASFESTRADQNIHVNTRLKPQCALPPVDDSHRPASVPRARELNALPTSGQERPKLSMALPVSSSIDPPPSKSAPSIAAQAPFEDSRSTFTGTGETSSIPDLTLQVPSATALMPPPPVPPRGPSSTASLRPPTLSNGSSHTSALAQRNNPQTRRQPATLAPPSTNGRLAPLSQPTTSTLPAPARPRQKVTLKPGHSPLDWAHLTSTTPAKQLAGVPQLTRITPSMLKQHDGRKGRPAWSAFKGRVYNIGPYTDFHPGGVGELRRGAGKIADKLFDEIHPWVNVDGMLGSCLVGLLVSESEVSSHGEEQGLDGLD